MLEAAYGKDGAAELASQFHESVIRRQNRTAIIRPELFYVPAPP